MAGTTGFCEVDNFGEEEWIEAIAAEADSKAT